MHVEAVLLWKLLLVGLATAVIKDTKHGPIEGTTLTLHNGKRVDSFLNVRFAKPPTGDLRFAKPEEPEPWTEPANATVLGPACPQGGSLFAMTHPGWDYYSEDCLHLNIHSPADEDGPHPVLVWFHGGGYSGSANIQYPGYFMASKGAVVVVTNYRLGIYGFASTDDDVAPGNWGLWDQNLALKWVQENVANFGGDPNLVTIFGQSAGASSSGLHLVSPQSSGLFHRAIYESGNDLAMWAINYPNSKPAGFLQQVARHVNVSCPDDDSQAMVDCLRTKDWDLLWRIRPTCTTGYFCLGFAPVVDGPGGFLPKEPRELRQEGAFANVPLMSGQTNKDGSPYTLTFIPSEDMDEGFNRTYFEETLRTRLINYFSPLWNNTAKITEDVFQAINFFYTNQPYDDDKEENRQAFNDMVTDVGFGYSANDAHKFHAVNNSVYTFVLAYRSVNASDWIPEWMGVPHNGEIPYVWGLPYLQLNDDVRDHSEIHFDIVDWNDYDIKYSDFVQDLWYNFAKHGNPTPTPVQTPEGTEFTWDAFTNDDMNYLLMDREQSMQKNYRQKNFAFWTRYATYLTGVELLDATTEKASKDGTQLSSGQVQQVMDNFWQNGLNALLP